MSIPGKLPVRKSDGQVFESSFPDGDYNPYADLLTPGPHWYFRAIRWNPRRWWQRGRWERTGEIWEPTDPMGREFDVLDEKTLIAAALTRRSTEGVM